MTQRVQWAEYATILIATLMICIWFLPVTLWHPPQYQLVQTGFDPAINYVSTARDGSTYLAQSTESPLSVDLVSWGSSHQYLHIDTFSYRGDITTEFTVDVLRNQMRSLPLTVDVQDPRGQVEYSLNFTASPENAITSKIMDNGRTISQRDLGRYAQGYPISVSVSRSIGNGTIIVQLSGTQNAPSDNSFLVLMGGLNSSGYSEVSSPLIPITGGGSYHFGADLKSLPGGAACYELSLDWYTKKGAKVSSSNDWRCTDSLAEWATHLFNSDSPTDARFARLRLAAGSGDNALLVTNVFLDSGNDQRNLVPDPYFSALEGWSVEGSNSSIGSLVVPSRLNLRDSITIAQAPSLFAAVPVSVAIESSSIDGLVHITVSDLQVVVPNQLLTAMKVSDIRAAISVYVLAGIGLFVLGITGFSFIRSRIPSKSGPLSTIHVRKKPFLQICFFLGVSITYLLANISLFSLGAHYYDFFNAQLWSYITGRYGISAVYALSNVAAIPNPYNAVQSGSAAFPYGPVMGYYFGWIGWFVNSIFPYSQFQVVQTSQFMIKFMNSLCGLGSSFLVYLILRGRNFSVGNSLVGMSVLLLNPVLWFVDSIWGETHAFTILLLLCSIFFAQKNIYSLAWGTLFSSILTRPEVLPPAILLMIFMFFRTHSLKRSIRGFALGIIMVFVLLTPLMIAYSPSLPVDVNKFAFAVQNGSDHVSEKFLFNSLDSYNVWPIFTGILDGASGHSRFWTPSVTIIAANLTYLSLSNYLFFAVFVFLALLILRRKASKLTGREFSIIAASSLSFLMIRVGISVHAFLLAIPLLILAMRPGKDYESYIGLGIVTFTTLVATWGSIPAGLSSSAPLYPSANTLTAFFAQLYSTDWFITLGVALNSLVLAWILKRAIGSGPTRRTSVSETRVALPELRGTLLLKVNEKFRMVD